MGTTGGGYNDMCPNLGCNPIGYNHNAPTGCVATAMAQVIRYWAAPTTGGMLMIIGILPPQDEVLSINKI